MKVEKGGKLRYDKDPDGNLTYLAAFAFKVASPQAEQEIITYAEENRMVYREFRIGEMLSIRYLLDKYWICQVGVMQSSIISKYDKGKH